MKLRKCLCQFEKLAVRSADNSADTDCLQHAISPIIPEPHPSHPYSILGDYMLGEMFCLGGSEAAIPDARIPIH